MKEGGLERTKAGVGGMAGCLEFMATVEAICLAAAAWEGTIQDGGAIWRSEGTAATYLWREEKSHRAGVRHGHEKPADTPLAKPRKVWHFCQFSFSKCQLAQNAKLKCQTIGPLFFSFFGKF